jgi:hypothetical protein
VIIVCRLPHILELGTYADAESALLVSDAHELLHGRTTHLHLLIPDDVEYLHTLHVLKRGSALETPLVNVLHERLWKTSVKRDKIESINPPAEQAKVASSALLATFHLPVEASRTVPDRTSSVDSTERDRKNRFLQRFRDTMICVPKVFNQWDLLDSMFPFNEVSVALLGAMSQAVETNSEVEPLPSAPHESTVHLIQLMSKYKITRCAILNIIESLFPGLPYDVFPFYDYISRILPEDAPTFRAFSDIYTSCISSLIGSIGDELPVSNISRCSETLFE